MAYTVGEVARLAGVTNRTLHHYDEIGLLTPSGRTPSGYRLYDRKDLERLQEILYFRELGFGLEEIRTAVTDPAHDRGEAFRQQRNLLLEHIERLESLVSSLDAAIDALEKFKQIRSRSEPAGDVDELITRAKSKKALIESENAEAAAATGATPSAPGAAGATPPPSGATAVGPATGALPAASKPGPAKPQPEAKPASGAFPPASGAASGQQP